MPADSTCISIPRSLATCARTASPIGDRQIFPRHTTSTLGLSDILVRKGIRVNRVQGEDQRKQKICTKRSVIYSSNKHRYMTIRIPDTAQSPTWNHTTQLARSVPSAVHPSDLQPAEYSNPIIPLLRAYYFFVIRHGLVSQITALPICPVFYPKEAT